MLALIAALIAVPAPQASAGTESVPPFAWKTVQYEESHEGGPAPFGRIETGDVTGDGRSDVVGGFGAEGMTFIAVVPQLANGTLGNMQLTELTDTFGNGPHPLIEVGDFDGDGDTDVVGGTSSGVDVWFQKPDGTLGNHRYTAQQGVRLLKAVDWDGDGDMEFLTIAETVEGFAIRLFARSDDATWSSRELVSPDEVSFLSSLDTVDLDGDGRVDIVTNGDPGILLFRHLVGGGVSKTMIDDGFYYEVAAGDLNHDGNSDVLATADEAYTLSGDGNGDVAAPVLINTNPGIPRIADINGDGWVDVVFSAGYSDDVVMLLQGAAGIAAPNCRTDYVTPSYGRPSVADMNGDGKMDIVMPGWGSPSFSILRNSPKGSTWIGTDLPSTSVYAGDPWFVSGALELREACPSTGPAGTEVELVRTMSGGTPEVVATGITGDFGRFTVSDSPQTPGTYSYVVRFDGDPLHPVAETSPIEVTAIQQGNELRLAGIRESETFGGTSRFEIRLSSFAATDNLSVAVYATPEGQPEHLVGTYEVDPTTGVIAAAVNDLRRDTMIRAVWEGDDAWEPVTVIQRVQVHVKLTGKMFRADHKAGKTYVYRSGVDPVFGAAVTPKSAGEVMKVFVERRVSGGWRKYLHGSAEIRRGAIFIGIPHQYLDGHTRYRVQARHSGEGTILQGDATKWFNFVVD